MLLLEDKALKLIKTLEEADIIPDLEFGYDEDTGELDMDEQFALCKILTDIGVNGFTDSGASKFVFVFPEQYVVKIGFEGVYSYDDGYFFEPFDDDYCELEYENYLKAEEAGLDFLFAEIKPLYKIGSRKFYIQEYVNFNINLTPSEKSKTTAKRIKENSGHFCSIDIPWLASVIEAYGEEIAEQLMDFIKETKINDLHCGNCGYDLKGFPKLADYSGWFEG